MSWLGWDNADEKLRDFTSRLITLRKEHPVFHRRRWFHELPQDQRKEEIIWYRPDGEQMQQENWESDKETFLIVYLNGETPLYQNPFEEPKYDDSFFLVMNAHHEDVHVTLPGPHGEKQWLKVFDTSEGWCDNEQHFDVGMQIEVLARSCWLLRHPNAQR